MNKKVILKLSQDVKNFAFNYMNQYSDEEYTKLIEASDLILKIFTK